MPAREGGGGNRARLRKGIRETDGRGAARRGRAPAWRHGDLLRTHRPRPGRDLRRCRPDGHDAPSPQHRLDPQRERPRERGPGLHEVGRPAVLDRRGAGVDRTGLSHSDLRAGRTRLHRPGRRLAGGSHRGRHPLARARPARPAYQHRAGSPRARTRGRDARDRRTPRHDSRLRGSRPGGLRPARGACRAARDRRRRDRGATELPQPASAERHGNVGARGGGSGLLRRRQGHGQGDSEARLDHESD